MTTRQILLAFAAIISVGCTSHTVSVKSPDKGIEFILSDNPEKGLEYSIAYKGDSIMLPSEMGFMLTAFEAGNARYHHDFCGKGLKSVKVTRSSRDETWTRPWGENKSVRDRYNSASVRFEDEDGASMTIHVRAYDDGVGFRYEVDIPGADSLHVNMENTGFRFASDGESWSIPASAETYELDYRQMPLSGIVTANTPMTFRTAEGVYGSIHEAALEDYPEMTLTAVQEDSACCLPSFRSELAPWPDGVKARFDGGHFITPWRSIQIGSRAVDLINSNLIINLNDPCRIGDTSWIRPMKYVGIWWGMHLGIETWKMDERHGATTENTKEYIDFAAANNIQGVVIEGWNRGWESWGGMQQFDYTMPYPDFDMDEVARYAAEKGIQIIGHHETGGNIPNYERQLEKSYSWYADHGVHYVKTGYAGGIPGGHSHHGQYAVRHYRKVVETAARYRTCLDVHEPIKETGIRRTWPNMMTLEGAKGMEWNAWSEGNPPSHYVTLPFTRLLAGPMDYTPGTFDLLYENTRSLPQRKKWNDNDRGNSRVNTTLAHQIADWVVLYSPLQMASDLIGNYERHPAFQFFRDFDADCDWSEALDGEPGEFIAVVRRAGGKFFLGATTGDEGRTLTIPLDFLEQGVEYDTVIYADGEDAHWKTNPMSYRIEKRICTAADTLEVTMAPGGGQAVSFIRLGE